MMKWWELLGLITEFVLLSPGTDSEKCRRDPKHGSLSRDSVLFETSPLVWTVSPQVIRQRS